MQNVVLHSNNPYLLMRMFTDLMMSGKYKNDKCWNDVFNPFSNECRYLFLYCMKELQYHTHECLPDPIINLTERNYIPTLTNLLS